MIIETKNSTDLSKSRLNTTKNIISELEDKSVENSLAELKRKYGKFRK